MSNSRFWLQVCFWFLLTMLVIAVWLSFGAERPKVQLGTFPRLHAPQRKRKVDDACTDARPEKAHPNWFACPIDEQRMGEM